MKFKSFALAAALLATSGVASAAIEGKVSTGAAENSDLVLFIYDSVRDVSYVQDLEINYKDIIALNGNFSSSFNLDSSLLTQAFGASNVNDLKWSMAASGFDFLDPDGSTLGTITTTNSVQSAPLLDYGILANSNTSFATTIDAANLFTPIGTGAQAAVGAGGSTLSANVNPMMNNIWFAFQNTVTAAKVDVAQQLWFLHLDAAYEALPASGQTLLSVNSWVLDMANGKLFSAPTTNEVPLPAAAWLMLSALLGLGGIARRRRES
jgi:hypothetical protein